MGFASASREEKIQMMKTNNTRKTTKRLNKLRKKGKLSKDVYDKLKGIKAKKSKESHQRMFDIEDDWRSDRQHHYDDNTEDLPLDMYDMDIDWEKSAYAGAKRRHESRKARQEQDNDEDDAIETKKRKFKNELDETKQELLPIKLEDGRLIIPTMEKPETEEVEDEENEEDEKEEEEEKEEDLSSLSAADLLAKRKSYMIEFKQKIASNANLLVSNPQANIVRLRDLLQLSQGEKVHSLVRESIQKLALASTVQAVIQIIPGYSIRQLTAEEKTQKQKKETRKLVEYEENLLNYYLKFLKLCEKLSRKLCGKDRHKDENTFTFKMGILSIKAMARLITTVPHFNYSTNIVSTLVHLSLSKNDTVIGEVCGALAKLFREDNNLKMTEFGARTISTLVTKRKGRVPPQLISTFLSMNIREVKKEENRSGKNKIMAKKYRLKKERANKTAKKYKKQLDKLESDLKEIEAEESVSTKLKNATEAMKFVFQTFFSILKRMPDQGLLEPVLEGLSKFAHLLNVEFFDDIVNTMSQLIETKNLRLVDQLHCVNTVFVILSGEGQLLNVDPSKFYKSVYRILNYLPFEKNPEQRFKQVTVLSKTIDVMLSERRKQVPLSRVAAFVKRLLSIATLLDDIAALAILSLVRTLFIAHPKLNDLLEVDEEGCGPSGAFRCELDDPDVANAIAADLRPELTMLSRRRDKDVTQFASNILYNVPSSGPFKLNPHLTSLKSWELLEERVSKLKDGYTTLESKYLDDLEKNAKKRKQSINHGNIQHHIANWLENAS